MQHGIGIAIAFRSSSV